MDTVSPAGDTLRDVCGRYASTRSAADLSALFEAADETGGAGGWAPRYNVAPTDPVPLVRLSRERGRVLDVGRWGLFGSAKMINARAETVAQARAYAAAFAGRRALVPADGWYEWRRDGATKQAYFLTPADGSVLALAGLWSATEHGVTFTVITTAAAGELASVHDRMPVVLPASRWSAWLGGADAVVGSDGAVAGSPVPPAGAATADAGAASVLDPPAQLLAGLEVRPVGPAVGDVRNDGPELVLRAKPRLPEGLW